MPQQQNSQLQQATRQAGRVRQSGVWLRVV